MDFLAVKDKKAYHYTYYVTEAYGMAIDTTKVKNEIKVNKVWINEKSFSTIDDAYDYLQELTKDFSKETLVIYTFDLDKVWYSAYGIVEKGFSDMVLYMLPYNEDDRYKVEIRSLAPYVDGYKAACKELDYENIEALVAKKYAQTLYDDIFIRERKWYLTPYQRSKKLLDKAGSVAQTWPSWSDYQHLRYDVYRGGLCFTHFPGLRKQGAYLALDRTSAYPAELMLSMYPMGEWQWADETKWWNYHDMASYGHYKITFEASMKYFYLLNVYGLDSVEGYADLWLTDVDLVILQKYLDIKKIECDYLKVCTKDFLPKYFLDFVYAAYAKKVEAKRCGKADATTMQRKREVNAIYGNLIISTKSYEEYCKLSRATRPEWGIWCTCYERLALLDMVEYVDYALYGDTDSVYCKESDKSYAALYAYNRKIDEQLRCLCERTGYDYNILKELGTFKLEHKIIDFCARKTKQYGFIDEYGKEYIKCSGYADDTVNYENLVSGHMPDIAVQMTYVCDGKVKVREMSYVQAKLFSEMAKEAI